MLRRLRVILALGVLVPGIARATWPEDVVLSSMTEQGGEFVANRDLLARSYRQLVRELGALVVNPPGPAATTGIHGFDAELLVQYGLTEARYRGGEVSPWTRAHATEDNAAWLAQPTLVVSKGLPMSTEIGGQLGWIGGTSSGVAGGWGRIALVEGYRPVPDLTLHGGYAAYLGNPELDLGVLDFGVTVGGRWGVGGAALANVGDLAAWLDVSGLRTFARPYLSDEVATAIGAVPLGPGGEPVSTVVRLSAGIRVRSGPAFLRLDASWSPATIPTIRTGLGLTL